MNQRCKNILRTFFFAALCVVLSVAQAFAAEDGTNWETGTITVTGYGVASSNPVNMAQANQMGFRAAHVEALRQLTEAVNGVNVTAETTVAQAQVQSDIIRTRVSGVVQGAREIGRGRSQDGSYWVKLQMPMYGVSGSLASAVFENTPTIESFPEPVPSVAPAEPNVNVNVTVRTGGATPPPITPPPAVTPPPVTPSSGRAVGNFTGLIVDCRGLGLRPVMSPVIRNADGTPIYGYKNLDSKKVIHNGMAGYARDMADARRAGSNPLIVRAVALENHNGNPVVSTADANRILIENRASGFLDNCAVVFIR